jgi:4-hydroxy-tetrahydrodipicolinate reductase
MNIVVVGARGRLGSLIMQEAHAASIAAVAIGRGDDLNRALIGGVVVIDVTSAGATSAHAALCARKAAPLVVATTGLSDDDSMALDRAARHVPVLVAANLSVSAHVAAKLVRQAATHFPASDIEVVEVHHSKKKDAPSGTALMLAAAAADGRGAPHTFVSARAGQAPRQAGDIGVTAVRGGDVVGEHTVMFLGAGERLEVVHKVTDRGVFARGALAAARFVAGRAPGRYAMADLVAG